MQGELFTYDRNRRLVAFESHPLSLGRSCEVTFVFIGGLTDGFLALPFLIPLSEALAARTPRNASLVQCLLSSSYDGFGVGSLSEDADEIRSLVSHLTTVRGARKVVLIGHSTGCQDAVMFFSRFGATAEGRAVDSVILHGPVSDREFMMSSGVVGSATMKEVEDMVGGSNGHGIVPGWRYDGKVPMTADRLWSLCGAKMTDDDMFSNDLTDSEMISRLKVLSNVRRVAVVFCERDEYVPSHVNKRQLATRIARSIGNNSELFMVDDVHAISSKEGISTFIKIVLSFL